MDTPEGIEKLDRLAESVDSALDELKVARATAEVVAAELVTERHWRRVAGWVFACLSVVLGIVLLYISISLSHQDTLLSRTSAISDQNRRTLAAIEAATGSQAQRTQAQFVQGIVSQVVDETDCRVRDDLASVLHHAIPVAVVVLPPTPTCPAFTP